MAKPKAPLSPRTFTRHALESPALLSEIVEDFAEGGDLIAFCKNRGLQYGQVANWLIEDEARREIWNAARGVRNERAIEQFLAQIRKIGAFDITQLYDENSALKPMNEWPPGAGEVVIGVDVDEIWEGVGRERTKIGECKRVRLSDRLKAIELLGKNLGIFVERHEVTVSKTHEQLINESYENKKEVKDVVQAQDPNQTPPLLG